MQLIIRTFIVILKSPLIILIILSYKDDMADYTSNSQKVRFMIRAYNKQQSSFVRASYG